MALQINDRFGSFLLANSTNQSQFMAKAADFAFYQWVKFVGSPGAANILHANNTEANPGSIIVSLDGLSAVQFGFDPDSGSGADTVNGGTAPSDGSWFLVVIGYDAAQVGSEYRGWTAISGTNTAASVQAAVGPTVATTRMWIGRQIDATISSTFLLGPTIISTDTPPTDARVTTVWNGGVPSTSAAIATATGADVVIPHINTLTPTTGSDGFGCLTEPTWVDGGEATFSQPAIANVPAVRNGHLSTDPGNTDYMMFGDSVAGDSRKRIPLHFVNEMARKFGTALKKFGKGYDNTNQAQDNIMDSGELQSGTAVITDISSGGAGYGLRSDATFMAFPPYSGMTEIAFGAAPTGINVFLIDIQTLAGVSDWSGTLLNWIVASDTVDMTPLIYINSTAQFPEYIALNNTSSGTTVDCSTASNTANVINPMPTKSLTVEVGKGKRYLARFVDADNTSSFNTYLTLAGAVCNNTSTTRGVGLFIVADSSWSVSGHAADTSATSDQDKTYSDAEVEPVMSAYYTSGRRMCFILYIATEVTMQTDVETWITRMKARAASVGITDYYFLLVSHLPHQVGTASLYHDRVDIDAAAVAFDTIAKADVDGLVQHVSMHKLLYGAYLHDALNTLLGPNDANSPQLQAIQYYDTLHGSDLETEAGQVWLDTGDLHPADFEAVKGTAEVVVDAIQQFSTVRGVTYDTTRDTAYDTARDTVLRLSS